MTQSTKKRGKDKYNRNFNIGDLVKLAGYTEIFRVDGYKEINEYWTEGTEMCAEFYIEYWLQNVDDENDFEIGYDEDMTLLAPVSDAKKWLRNRQARERRRRRQSASKPTVDDLLDDFYSVSEAHKALKHGPMKRLMGELKEDYVKKLRKATGGGEK